MILDELRPQDVKDGKTFARFVQQRYGTPYPTHKSLAILNRQAKALFKEHPDCNWRTLVEVAQYCHGKKRRMPEAYFYVNQFRWAYADGAIQLRPVAEMEIEDGIKEALEVERDPEWRSSLMRADGVTARRAVLTNWRKERGGVGKE